MSKVLEFIAKNWKFILNALFTLLPLLRRESKETVMKPTTKVGIKETLEVFDTGAALAAALKKAKADGTINWMDVPKFAPVITAAKKAAQDSHLIKAEVADLDTEETQLLLDKSVSTISALIDAILEKK